MKKFILVMMLFSLNVYATNVDLSINSKVKTADSTKVSSATIVAKLGEEWSLPFQGTKNLKFKMIVTKSQSNDLMFDVKFIELINGKENILSSPKIITALGKEAKITQSDSKGPSIEMTILPSRITE